MNLRTRFAIVTALLVMVFTMSMSVGAYKIASGQLERQVDTSLNQRASRIIAIVNDPRFDWNQAFGRGPANQAIMQTEVDAITQVRLSGGQILKRPEYPLLPLTGADTALRPDGRRVHRSSVDISGHRFRTLTVSLADGSLLQLAKDTQVVVEARNGMRRWFPLLAALQVVIAAFVGWLFARRISKPIENLASAAGTIAETQDLSHDIPAGGAGEVGALVSSFNSMLTALRNSLSRQRQLVQDASHELRTPLTSLRANTELLERSGLSDADRNAILADIRAEIDDLTGLSSELSSLATDHRANEQAIPVNLVDIATEVVSRAQRRTSVPVTLHTGANTIVVAPTNRKFQPAPFSIIAIRKFQISMPSNPHTTPALSTAAPRNITLVVPYFWIRLPVKNAGTNIPNTCSMMTECASVCGKPQDTMAIGDALMRNDIVPNDIMPAITDAK